MSLTSDLSNKNIDSRLRPLSLPSYATETQLDTSNSIQNDCITYLENHLPITEHEKLEGLPLISRYYLLISDKLVRYDLVDKWIFKILEFAAGSEDKSLPSLEVIIHGITFENAYILLSRSYQLALQLSTMGDLNEQQKSKEAAKLLKDLLFQMMSAYPEHFKQLNIKDLKFNKSHIQNEFIDSLSAARTKDRQKIFFTAIVFGTLALGFAILKKFSNNEAVTQKNSSPVFFNPQCPRRDFYLAPPSSDSDFYDILLKITQLFSLIIVLSKICPTVEHNEASNDFDFSFTPSMTHPIFLRPYVSYDLNEEQQHFLWEKLSVILPEINTKNLILNDKELSYLLYQDLCVSLNVSKCAAPIGLPNNKTNSCYRNAVHQMMFSCLPLLKSKFKEPFTSEIHLLDMDRQKLLHFKHVLRIYVALKLLLNSYLENNSPIQQQCDRLLDAIIQSGFMPSLNDENWDSQQDASEYLETIFENVLGIHLSVVMKNFLPESTYEEIQNIISEKSEKQQLIPKGLSSEIYDVTSLIQLPLSSERNVQEQINHNFSVNAINDKKNPWSPTNDQKQIIGTFTNYLRQENLKGTPPDFTALLIKRRVITSGAMKYVDTPFMTPKNQILDLSKAWERPPGSIEYNIIGSATFYSLLESNIGDTFGHYIAHVNYEGKYFRCNDENISEVTQEEFIRASDTANILMLEKIEPHKA